MEKNNTQEQQEMIIDSIEESNQKCQKEQDVSFSSESSIENINDDLNECDFNFDEYDGFFSSMNNSNEIISQSNNKYSTLSSSIIFLNKKRYVSSDEIPEVTKKKITQVNEDFLLKLQETHIIDTYLQISNDSLFDGDKLNPVLLVNFIKQIFFSNITKRQREKLKNKKYTIFNIHEFNLLQDELINEIYPLYKEKSLFELLSFLKSSEKYSKILNADGFSFLEEIGKYFFYPKMIDILNKRTEVFVQIYEKISKKDKKFKNKIVFENVQNISNEQ